MTRPRTSSLGAYADIRAVLDAVLQKGDLVMTLDSPGQATNMRQRCYRYRKLLQDKLEKDLSSLIATGARAPGTLPETPYDGIFIQLEPGASTLLITNRDPQRFLSRLTTPDGQPVDLTPEGELEKAARRFAGSLDLD